jgi:hypothetical protein
VSWAVIGGQGRGAPGGDVDDALPCIAAVAVAFAVAFAVAGRRPTRRPRLPRRAAPAQRRAQAGVELHRAAGVREEVGEVAEQGGGASGEAAGIGGAAVRVEQAEAAEDVQARAKRVAGPACGADASVADAQQACRLGMR